MSSLAYVAVGGWLLARAAAPGASRVSLIPAGSALAGVGLASAGYHGPQPSWAEPVHEAAILGLGVVVGGRAVWWLASRSRRGGEASRRRGWWALAGGCGGAGLAAYVVGRTGGILCRPESLWQAHAAWHVLSAVALGGAVMATAERPGRPSPRAP